LAGSEAHEGIVSKHVEASSGGRGQDKNQKKKNRPVEAKARNDSRDIFFLSYVKKKERTYTLTRACMCVYVCAYACRYVAYKCTRLRVTRDSPYRAYIKLFSLALRESKAAIYTQSAYKHRLSLFNI